MKNNLDYMTQYRGFAIIMIVMVHCITRYLSPLSPGYSYIYAFFANSTDLFLFISGFLFEYLLYKSYTYKKFVAKKIRRLIIPYFLWSLPVVFVLFVLKDFDFTYLFYTIYTGLGHGNDAHWYIPFIFMVFLISPSFVLLQNRGVLYPIIMPIFLFISLTSERSEINLWYGQTMLFNLIGFFFLGMFFSHYRKELIESLYRFDWAFLVSGFLLVIISGIFNPEQPEHVLDSILQYTKGHIQINIYALNKFFFSIGYVLLFYRLDKFNLKFTLLNKIAHYSFGIYFCHLYLASVLDIFYQRVIGVDGKGDLTYMLTNFIIVFILSILLVYILRNTKYINNIIGV